MKEMRSRKNSRPFIVIFLKAASMNVTVFWEFASYSHIEIDGRFRGAYCFHHQCSEAVNTSETLINFYMTTRRKIPEDSRSYLPPRKPEILFINLPVLRVVKLDVTL
jgi:hypothetical protein